MQFQDVQQQALGFVVSQTSHIEQQVYQIRYPDIQYPSLVPVDTSANEWAKSITYFSSDKVGEADWFDHQAKDMPIADIDRQMHEHGVRMGGIGYRYTMQEIGVALMTLQPSLTTDKAAAARRAYEEFVEAKTLWGDPKVNWTGLLNSSAIVTVVFAAADGTGSSPAWSAKTPDLIIRDFNAVLTGINTSTLTVEMADTVLLPVELLHLLASTARSSGSDMNLMEWLERYNVYTQQTKLPLTIRAVRGLETAGDGGTGRMVAYRRDPQVLKLHLPMPHKFWPVWQTGPMIFDIPGTFRLGGLEIRLPKAVRYLDHIIDPST